MHAFLACLTRVARACRTAAVVAAASAAVGGAALEAAEPAAPEVPAAAGADTAGAVPGRAPEIAPDPIREPDPAGPGVPVAAEPDSVVTVAGDTLAVAPIRMFDRSRIPVGIASLTFGALVVGFVLAAQRGRAFYIRRIAGLEAVDEAVGRATEMGRPILFSPGLDPMDEVATVAAMNVLGQVARRVAHYGMPLLVPNRDPIVMTVAQEVVRDAFMSEGVPDRYREQDVYYTTYSQFGYAAAVAGTMMRDRPATNFFFGRFYAESLVLAETGNMTGAVQIAGTDADAQLPFFITACDYTLIGEELYAGSVYLSREPLLMGALKAQDAGKAIVLVILVVGSLLALFGVTLPPIANR